MKFYRRSGVGNFVLVQIFFFFFFWRLKQCLPVHVFLVSNTHLFDMHN